MQESLVMVVQGGLILAACALYVWSKSRWAGAWHGLSAL